MAALLLLLLVLLASGGGGHDVASLQLRGIPDSFHERAADAPALPQRLMDVMSFSGCGRFAGLLAATPNAREVFRQRLVGGGAGLTVFCPDDKAVAAFEPTLRALADDDMLAVLLHHGVAGRYDRAQLLAFEWVAVRTLAAADAATNRSQTIAGGLGHDGHTIWLEGRARITRTVSSEEAPGLVVHVVDAVLLPRRLQQKLDGEDDEAVVCRAAARVLARCTDPPKNLKTTRKKPETLF